MSTSAPAERPGSWGSALGEDGFRLEYEKNEGDGSLVFKLRDDVRVSVKAESPSKVRVTMWRGEDVNTFVHPDTGNINSANFRIRLAKAAGQKFGKTYDDSTDMGKKRIKLLEDDLGRVAAALEQKPDGEDDKLRGILDLLAGGPGPAEVLLNLAQVGEYFHDPDGEAYSTIPIEDHRETVPLKGRDFKRWLRHLYYQDQKGNGNPEPSPLRSQVVTDVVSQLEAKALFDGAEHPVHVRVAECAGRVYIDLCDESWRVVEIDSSDWRSVSDPPVKFVRAKGMAPLPKPTRSGDGAAILRGLLNLGDDQDADQAWCLILAWLTKALRARGPYPVLLLLGGQGTAKSTAVRVLRSLVDPSTVPLRTPPKNEHDLAIDSVSSWVLAFDNISELPGWLSDAVCRLATGGGYATRTLFSDRDQELFEAMRPVVLNGITDVASRPDLLDRAVIVNLKPISKAARREEKEILRELEDARPALLGFLFTAISEGLRKLPEVKLNGLPRMADFARWSVATEVALGGNQGDFMRAYETSQTEAVGQALEASPVAVPLWKFAAAHQGPEKAWTGTATELLTELVERVDPEVARAKGWPKAANALSRELKRLAPPLRDVGVFADQLSREGQSGSRKWSVHYVKPPRGGGEETSSSSFSSKDYRKSSSEPSVSSVDSIKSCKSQYYSTDDATDDNRGITDDTVSTDDASNDIVSRENSIKPGSNGSSDDTDGSDGIFPNPPGKYKEEGDGWVEV